MKNKDVTCVMIIDQLEGNPPQSKYWDKAPQLQTGDAFWQMMTKARDAFGTGNKQTRFLRLSFVADEADNIWAANVADVIRQEKAEVVLIEANVAGQKLAAALGIEMETGVAAHIIDITENKEGELTFLIPSPEENKAEEIFVPGAGPDHPAIATVRAGTFEGDSLTAGNFEIVRCDWRARQEDRQGFTCTGFEERTAQAKDITKAEIIFCGGYGIGSEETWEKIQALADKYGGATACTRPVVDAGWGADENEMIGTSGRSVRPKVYIGFGISGAAHHLCGIKDAGVIISINNDKNAEVFAASDYKGVFDAEAIIDELLKLA